MVGNDSSPHLEMFSEVSKPLSSETSEISKSRPKFRIELSYYHCYRKISIFQLSTIINPVSYDVAKAYKVIFGLIFGSAWTKTTFDSMRKIWHVSCKMLALIVMELDISSWKLVCIDQKLRFGFRKVSSIFQVRGICCNLLE